MKKQLITIIVFAAILGALGLTYYFVQKKQAEDELANIPEETPAVETIVLIDRPKEDVEKITIENENGVFTFIPKANPDDEGELIWELEEHPNLSLNNYNVNSMASPLWYLSPKEMLLPAADNPGEFGFDKPVVATAAFKDNSTETIYVGKKTPAGDFYYMMRKGDPAVYLMIPITGERFLYGYNEIIDKSIAQIDLSMLTYAYIYEKDKTEIEIAYPGEKSELMQEIESFGTAYLEMLKPYTDRDVYASSFVNKVSESFKNYSLGDLVEIDCQDLSKYGLSDPELTIILEDPDQSLHLLVGTYAPDESGAAVPENVYVCFGDSNNVFLMRSYYFNSLRGMNPIKFLDRFVILPNIESVDAVKIESIENGRSHDIIINHETEQTSDGRDLDKIYPTIDGTEVAEDPFRLFYRALIGLTIDIEITDYVITEEPLVTITYSFNTGEKDVVTKYYPYNDNFYAVQKDDEPIRFAVSKHTMKIMFDNMDSLLAE